MAVDPALDKTFDCSANQYAGIIFATTSLTGYSLNPSFTCDPIQVTVTITGYANTGALVQIEEAITVEVLLEGEAVIEELRTNWVGWSKIGSKVFQQDMTNDSGYRPMSWRGIVYNILPLGKNAVVYGSGGVSVLYPVIEPMPTFGCKDVLTIGIKNRTAVCGSLNKHYFIDKKGCLWTLAEDGVTKLGFEEYLAGLVNPVMHYDSYNDRVYISASGMGYTLSGNRLGGGYAKLTGFQYTEGSLLITSPEAVSIPNTVMLATDAIDMGYRGMKTIEAIQVGTDTDESLEVAIDYRYDKSDTWQTTNYVATNQEGVSFIRIAGVEFRIRIKNTTYNYFEIDYINIQYKRTDKRYIRGTIGGDTK